MYTGPSGVILHWKDATAAICLLELRSLLYEICQMAPIPSSLLDALFRFTESGGWEAVAAFFDTETFVNCLESEYSCDIFAWYAQFVSGWINDGGRSSLEAMAKHVRQSPLNPRRHRALNIGQVLYAISGANLDTKRRIGKFFDPETWQSARCLLDVRQHVKPRDQQSTESRCWMATSGLLITKGEGHVIVSDSSSASTGLHIQGVVPSRSAKIVGEPNKLLLLVALDSQPNIQFRYRFLGFTPERRFQKAPDEAVYAGDVRGYVPLIKVKGRWAYVDRMLKTYGWKFW